MVITDFIYRAGVTLMIVGALCVFLSLADYAFSASPNIAKLVGDLFASLVTFFGGMYVAAATDTIERVREATKR